MASGKVIGDAVQYRLDTPIASGAFSTVYRCTELASGRTYAMKVVDKKVAQRNKMTEALIREVNALEIAGSSPYVTGLVDKMVSKHNYYLVMDLAEGGTLLDLIREQRQELRVLQASLSSGRSLAESLQSSAMPFMQYDRVQHYFKQLLLALSTLHDRNVVHRDVKPENILLNKRRTRLVLSDFGFACHCLPGVELHRACGTLRYCAPELLREYPAYDGRKVDVWAAGVTLYVMLFGGFPYRCTRPDPDALLEVMETTTYRLPRPIPPPIEDMLQHMLCMDAAQRWSVKQLLLHPWMAAGPELRTPSVRSTSTSGHPPFSMATPSGGPLASPTSPASPTAFESVTELLSEDCPPVDALPSDEDNVDDGFYQSSEIEHFNSSVSSSPNHSTTSTQPRQRSLTHSPHAYHREVLSLPVSTPGSPVRLAGSAAGAPANTAVSAFSRMSTKQEILQHGTVSTSMTSIESSLATDDENRALDDGYDDEEEEETDNETHYWDEVREGAACAHDGGRRGASLSSSLSTGALCTAERPVGGLVRRYAYGVWLTARMAAHLAAFIVVCVVAVALRVLANRDIIDLPLPESLRDYVAFLLATPLCRPHSHLAGTSAAAVSASHSTAYDSATAPSSTSLHSLPSSPLTAEQLEASLTGAAARLAPAQLPEPIPLPGSGLRHYVRTADQLMRDSFVGTVVMSHNASLADLVHRRGTGTPRPGESASTLPSLTSSPGAPSLATVAPAKPSRSRRHARERDEAAESSVEKRRGGTASPAASADESGERTRDSSLRKEPSPRRSGHAARPPLIALVHSAVPDVTASSSPSAAAVAVAKTPMKSAGQPVDSQEGATDDTGSGDSALEKSTHSSPQHNWMFLPIVPMPTTVEGSQRGMEDFPASAGKS